MKYPIQKGSKGYRPSKKTKSTTSKGKTYNIAKKAAYDVLETKNLYSNIDESTFTSGTETALSGFNTVVHGNQGNQRIGQKIKPVRFTFKGYVRPRSLHSNEDDAYDSAMYVRCIIVKQKPSVNILSHTPVPISISNNDFFKKGAETTGPIANDFRDLFYDVNTRLMTVISDTKHFFPMQRGMRNIKEIDLNYLFPKTDMNTFIDNSGYPEQILNVYFISRFVDDDGHTSARTLEICAESKFYYKDV